MDQTDSQLVSRIQRVFGNCLGSVHFTRLSGGHAEPFYRAPTDGSLAEICFRENFPRSCLHEIAHWSVAGAARRSQHDFGYWYAPDGRDSQAQAHFFRVEAKPQALEKAFALTIGLPFRVSCDNLYGESGDEAAFAAAVDARLRSYLEDGFPKRAEAFLIGLWREFRPERAADASEEFPAWLRTQL